MGDTTSLLILMFIPVTRSKPEDRALRTTTLLPLCTPATRMAMVPGFKEGLTLRLWFEKHLRDFLTLGLKVNMKYCNNLEIYNLECFL